MAGLAGLINSPLAPVIVGGLISSTILSRLVTPVMYKLLPPSVERISMEETVAAPTLAPA